MRIAARGNDFAWNLVGTLFRMGGSFLLLPFLLSFLDDDALGLWYVFLAIYSFVVLFQAGFVPTFARNVAYCWSGARGLARKGLARGADPDGSVDFDLLADIVSASRILYRAIALAVLLALLAGGTAYVVHVAGHMEGPAYLPAWCVFCLSAFLNIYFSYYESLLRGVGRFPEVNKATIASSLCQIGLSAGLLFAGLGLMACALAFCAQGLVFRLMCRCYFLRCDGAGQCLNGRAGLGSREGVREVLSAVVPNAVKDTAVSLANYAVTTANTIVCSLFMGLADTGSYSVVLQLVNAAASCAGVALSTNQPALQSAFARGDEVYERELTAKTAAGYVLSYAACILGIALVVMPLVIWMRPSFSCDWALFALMASYVFLWKQHSMCATFITNANDLPFVPAFVASSVAGVALTVVLVRFTGAGLYGLVLGQAVAQLCYNNWKWPEAAASRLGTTYPALLREGMGGLWTGMCRLLARRS